MGGEGLGSRQLGTYGTEGW